MNRRLGLVIAVLALILGLQAGATLWAENHLRPGLAGAAGQTPDIQYNYGGIGQVPQPDYVDRVKLPTDPKAKRKIDEVNRLVKLAELGQVEEWQNAAELLQRILGDVKADVVTEDVFLQDEKGRWVSVRTEANRILSQLPAEGLQYYEQHSGSDARAELERGKAASDARIYAKVALLCAYTKAGAEAAELLATYHMDDGRYAVAALCFERMLEREGALDSMSPVSLFKAAIAFERAGDAKNRDRVWNRLEARLKAGGRPLPPALAKKEPKELKELLATAELTGTRGSVGDYLLFGGSHDRSAQFEGSSPFLVHQFRVETIREAATRKWVDEAIKKQQGKGPVLSSFHPIAIGDKLIFRSYWGLHAYHLKDIEQDRIKAGDLAWESDVPGGLDNLLGSQARVNEQILRAWMQQFFASNSQGLLYDNSSIGTLSSDGQRVYLIEDAALPPWQMNPYDGRFPGNLGMDLSRWNRNNKLKAYSLQTGKLVWDLGTSEGEQEFTDHFFLGPPLPMGDKLYALVEVKEEIRLLTLEPWKESETKQGCKLIRKQPLCVVDRDLMKDPTRRTQAAFLSYGDGVLVCSTNAGVILGVDMLTGSLLWAHSYLDENTARRPREDIYNPRPMAPSSWAASAPVVRNGKVVVTPPDGNAIICLNLRDGTSAWPSRVQRVSDLYLAGVYNDKVLLIGQNSVRALNFKDGKEAWSRATGLPSGRGVANNDNPPLYFLPLQKGEVWAINIENGEPIGKSQSPKNEIPGNLVFHGTDVLSQTPTAIAVYPQLAAKEAEITALLKDDPRNAKGLTERGELRLHRGDLPGAVEDLHLALENKPPPLTRLKASRKLYEALGDLLDRGFVENERYLDEYGHLTSFPAELEEKRMTWGLTASLPVPGMFCDVPELMSSALGAGAVFMDEDQLNRRANFLRLVAKGRQDQGRLREAIQAYMDFANLGSDKLLVIPTEPNTRPRPDYWAQGRIADFYMRRATPEQRKEMDAIFEEQLKTAQSATGVEPLRRFVKIFGSVSEQGYRGRLLLAERLMEARLLDDKTFIEAEGHLALLESASPALAAKSLEARARLLTRKGYLEDAASYYRDLVQKYPKVEVRDGKTGEDIFSDLTTDKRFWPYLEEPASSPLGSEEIEVQQPIVQGNFPPSQTIVMEPADRVPPFFQRHRLTINQTSRQFKVIDKITGSERASFLLPPALPPNYYNPYSKMRVSYRLTGHIVVFSWGQHVYAYDPIDNKELWKYNLLPGIDVNSAVQQGLLQINLDPNTGKLMLYDPQGYVQKIGELGTVGPNCVCFVVKDEGLVAVDPLTGKKMWVRAEVTPGSEIFGDGQYVCLIASNNPRPGYAPGQPGDPRAMVLRAIDGMPVPVSDNELLQMFQRKLQVVGRHILLRDNDAQGGWTLRLYDPVTGKDAWTKHYADAVVLMKSQVGDWTGILDRAGKATIFDVRTGQEIQKLEVEVPQAGLSEVHLLRDGGSIYLAFNGPQIEANPQPGQNPAPKRRIVQTQPSGLRTVLVNGPLYAFDRATGEKRWEKEVNTQSLVVEQFEESPLAVFATWQVQWWQPPNQPNAVPIQRAVGAVSALDKRDGKLINAVPKDQNDPIEQRLGPCHTLNVDLRSGTVEVMSSGPNQQSGYKVVFLLNGKKKSEPGVGQPALAPPTTPPPGIVPGPEPQPLPIRKVAPQPVPIERVVPQAVPQAVPLPDVPAQRIEKPR